MFKAYDNKLIFASLICFYISYACSYSPSGTLKYNTLNYDTSKIVIFKWDTTAMEEFPKNSDPLPLTQNDLKIVDSLLNSAIEHYNIEEGKPRLQSFLQSGFYPLDSGEFIINLPKYRRQYFPYKDVNGQKIVYICCFRNEITGRKKEFTDWKKRPYRGRLHGGTLYFYIKINLSENKSVDFYTT